MATRGCACHDLLSVSFPRATHADLRLFLCEYDPARAAPKRCDGATCRSHRADIGSPAQCYVRKRRRTRDWLFAMREGLQRVVKASITGSIPVNLLLTLGVSMIAREIRHKTLRFNVLAARTHCTTVCLAAIGLIFPAVYHFLVGPGGAGPESRLSLEFAVILLVTYGLGLLFTLHTHWELLAVGRSERVEDKFVWSGPVAAGVLMVSAGFVGWIEEILATSLQCNARAFGLSDLFVGLVVVAVAGNAAESTSAIRAAVRNRMDLAVGIAIGSSIQIALFVAPALVLASHWIGPHPIDLVFTSIELVAVILAITITTQVAGDGESNWLEGVQLLVVYVLIAIMVFSLPTTPDAVLPGANALITPGVLPPERLIAPSVLVF